MSQLDTYYFKSRALTACRDWSICAMQFLSFLVGTKSDLSSQKPESCVSSEITSGVASQLRCTDSYRVSSVTGEGVEDMLVVSVTGLCFRRDLNVLLLQYNHHCSCSKKKTSASRKYSHGVTDHYRSCRLQELTAQSSDCPGSSFGLLRNEVVDMQVPELAVS